MSGASTSSSYMNVCFPSFGFVHLHHWGILVWQWHLHGWQTKGKNWFKFQIVSAFLAINSHNFVLHPEMLQNKAFPWLGVEIVHTPSTYMLHIFTCFSVPSYFLTTKNHQSIRFLDSKHRLKLFGATSILWISKTGACSKLEDVLPR